MSAVHSRLLTQSLAAACLSLGLAGCAVAQSQNEAALKVKITLSMTRFAQWSQATSDVLRLCVAQRDAVITRAFGDVDGQVINGRRIQVLKAPPVAGCSVLYVHASAERVPELIRSAGAGATLIVGDAEGTLAQGGMVELVPVNDSLRFDVNMAALRQSQVTLSSQVLKLARQVRE